MPLLLYERCKTQFGNDTHVVAHIAQRLKRGHLDPLVELPGDVAQQSGEQFWPLVLSRHTRGVHQRQRRRHRC